MSTSDKLVSLIKPVVIQCGYDLFDLEFAKEGQNWILRVYIDKEDGAVTINSCETVSRAVEKVLDEADPIQQSYILEVSSPGADRPLKKDSDYVKYKGHRVDVKLYKAIDKAKLFSGELVDLEAGVVTITDDDGGLLTFEKKDIASCRLAVIF